MVKRTINKGASGEYDETEVEEPKEIYREHGIYSWFLLMLLGDRCDTGVIYDI